MIKYIYIIIALILSVNFSACANDNNSSSVLLYMAAVNNIIELRIDKINNSYNSASDALKRRIEIGRSERRISNTSACMRCGRPWSHADGHTQIIRNHGVAFLYAKTVGKN